MHLQRLCSKVNTTNIFGKKKRQIKVPKRIIRNDSHMIYIYSCRYAHT